MSFPFTRCLSVPLPSLCLLLALALGSCLTRPAHTVIIDSGDGTGNTTAPGDDPGWIHVGPTVRAPRSTWETAGCSRRTTWESET